MMSGVEAQGHGPLHGGGVFPGKGLHLGHMRGTAEGPPGLRPQDAETSDFVRGPGKGKAADSVESRVLAKAEAIFDKADADGDGQIGRTEFYDFTEMVVRDGLEALLAGIGGDGNGGDDDDPVGDAAVLPPEIEDDGGAADALPNGDSLGGVAAAPAEEVAPTGDPVFDLTLSGIAERVVANGGAEAALALLEAAQGYSEAAAAN